MPEDSPTDVPGDTPPTTPDPGDGATRTLPPDAESKSPRPRRRLDELARATDDPMVSGVSAGIARHFDVDPIIVRVAFVALSVVGLAGLVLYLGLWFLLPYDDGRKSVAAGWFGLEEREPEFRTVGLVVTALLAAAAVFGDTGWFWGGPAWALLLFLGIFWLVAVLPRRRRAARAAGAGAGAGGAEVTATASPVAPPPGPRQPPVLLGLTACVAAISLGSLWLYGELADVSLGHGTYLATALLVTGLGVVAGAFWGRSGGLIGIGVLLVVLLSLSTVVPGGPIGDHRYRPDSAAGLEASYQHGIGRFELNLSDLTDPADVAELAGRTVEIDAGIGETVVIVPEGLPVTVRTDLEAGQIDVFERSVEVRGPRDGDQGLDVPSLDPDALVLDIDQTFGQIKVVRS